MQVVITMGGLGQRFKDQGLVTPKPFITVAGKPVIKHLVDSFSSDWKYFFVINEQLLEFNAKEKLEFLFPNCTVIISEYSSRGPIDTVFASLDHLNPNKPVVVSYCDYSLIWDPINFEKFVKEQNSDAVIIGYQGFHPTYFGPNSYCHLKLASVQTLTPTTSNLEVTNNLNVLNIQEKALFTSNLETEFTSCGGYYFKSANFLKDCLEQQLLQNLNYKGEFYLSLAIKAMMNKSFAQEKRSRIHYYPIDHFVQFGTPADTERYEFWNSVLVKKESPKNFMFQFIAEENDPLNFSKELYGKEKMYWEKVFKIN